MSSQLIHKFSDWILQQLLFNQPQPLDASMMLELIAENPLLEWLLLMENIQPASQTIQTLELSSVETKSASSTDATVSVVSTKPNPLDASSSDPWPELKEHVQSTLTIFTQPLLSTQFPTKFKATKSSWKIQEERSPWYSHYTKPQPQPIQFHWLENTQPTCWVIPTSLSNLLTTESTWLVDATTKEPNTKPCLTAVSVWANSKAHWSFARLTMIQFTSTPLPKALVSWETQIVQ